MPINKEIEVKKQMNKNTVSQQQKDYKDSPEFKQQVNTTEVGHKSLPKQIWFKTLKVIDWKILMETHLPMTIKEIQVGI